MMPIMRMRCAILTIAYYIYLTKLVVCFAIDYPLKMTEL
jgi:hypothetical protein